MDFLTLGQAAALAEFEDDEEALSALYQTAKDSPGQFTHVAARLRATRAEREAKAGFAAGLEAQGFAIYGDRPYVPWTLALENLRDGGGNQISPEAHVTCRGRAVTITYEWDWAPGAEAAYRAAHGLAGEHHLAGVEFADDEEARAAGFVPGWQIGRHLCTEDPPTPTRHNTHARAAVRSRTTSSFAPIGAEAPLLRTQRDRPKIDRLST